MDGREWTIVGWAMDFTRAMWERNWLCRVMMRLFMGRYAYREFVGLLQSVHRDWNVTFEYSLKGMDYHQDKMPIDFHNVDIDYWSKNGHL